MNRLAKQLKEQMIKRMAIDNPWWITGTIADDFKDMPERVTVTIINFLIFHFCV